MILFDQAVQKLCDHSYALKTLRRGIDIFRFSTAISLFLTLLLTPSTSLFYPMSGEDPQPVCNGGIHTFSLYCVSPFAEAPTLAIVASLAILLFVFSGFFPRISALLHWWTAWSFMQSSNVVDGGDQAASNLLFLALLCSLTDNRRNIWKEQGSEDKSLNIFDGIALGGYYLIIIQVAGLYFHSTVAKFDVPQWKDGSAFWYWMQLPNLVDDNSIIFDWVLDPLIANKIGSTFITYGTLSLQTYILVALFLGIRARIIAVAIATFFHLAIAITMGLWSFSIVMIVADGIALLRPWDKKDIEKLYRNKELKCSNHE